METRYFLKSEVETVYFIFTINGKRVKYSTGQKCKPSNWANGQPKQITATKELRDNLNRYKIELDGFINNYIKRYNKLPSQYTLKEMANHISKGHPRKNNQSQSLNHYFQMFIKEQEATKKASTINKKTREIGAFINFIEGNKRRLDDLNQSLFIDYRNHLDKEKKEVATVNSYLKNLISFLNWLYKKDYTIKPFSKFVEKHREKTKTIVALNDEELQRLELLDLTNNKRLERIRDCFLFSCYTGLRFGDCMAITKRDIINNKVVINQQKTGDRVTIKLIDEAISILEKYNYQLPMISNQKTNKYLKELFKLYDFDRPIKQESYTPKGLKAKPTKALYELISFHAGRKTFITSLFGQGVSPNVVKGLSGHSDYRILSRYEDENEAMKDEAISKLSRSTRYMKKVN